MNVLVIDSFYQFSLDLMMLLLQVLALLASPMACNQNVSQGFLFFLINNNSKKY